MRPMFKWPDSISRRMLLANAAVLAFAFALLVVTPVTVSARIRFAELGILITGGLAMLVINWWLVRRALEPLRRLSRQMELADLSEGAVEIPVPGAQLREIEVVTQALSTMVDRLAAERSQTSRAVLIGQEGERLRVARELHDEVAQGLVAVQLMAERAGADAPPRAAAEFAEIADRIHFYLDELRRIAHELRPETLDDLGLINALIALGNATAADRGMAVERDLPPQAPDLSDEQELVVYRIAQEALANAARHSHGSRAGLRLATEDGRLTLEVTDDGVGVGTEPIADDGVGIKGMRERARLIGGSVEIAPGAERGTRVALTVPLEVEG